MLNLYGNELSGKIPASVQQLDVWKTHWTSILNSNNFETDGLLIPTPEFSLRTLDGKIMTEEMFSQNKYTILYSYWTSDTDITSPIVNLYERYKTKGLDVFGLIWPSEQTESDIQSYIKEQSIPWSNCLIDNNTGSTNTEHISPFSMPSTFYVVVDSEGHVVLYHLERYSQDDFISTLISFLEHNLS